ncbi:MAG: TonB-dependent receptor plug domain-containing protein [Lacunisphaera sp.]|nr:TonB-dependent receptor plug domain-containing protein [Lacunisphaera sp.]
MNSKRVITPSLHLLIGVSLSILPLRSFAQAAPAAPAEETIVLNPFVVTSDSTKGYYATETLSGTQLRTPIRDLANPITILTEEFMRDIGAVNYQEALEFLPSTREFKGDASDPESVGNRNGNPYSVRGFTSNTLTNNFFTTRVKMDNFNTETVTQSRGPNSLLFGMGSVGGGLDATNKVGKFNANSYGAEARFDSDGTKRVSVDINQILIPKKLAVRFAGLSYDQRTPRDLQYTRRNSAYLNLTIQPFKGATINVNAETGQIQASIPRAYLAYDSVSAWLNDPRSPFDKANRIDNLLVASGSTTTRNAARNLITGVTQGFSTSNYLVYVMNNPTLGVQNWKWKSRGSEAYVNGLNQNSTSISPLTVVPGIEFPLDTMVPGPSEHFDTEYEKYSATYQQKIFEKTYLELAGAYEDVHNEDWQPIRRGDYEVFIDPNFYLPTQLASSNPDPTKPLNPYFGVPYVEGSATWETRDTVIKQYRATLTHQIDLSRIEPLKGFDLGKFSVVGFYYHRSNDSYFSQPEEMTTTTVLTNGVVADTQNQIRRRYYLVPGQAPYFPAFDPSDPSINQAADASVAGGVIPAVTTGFVNRLNPVYAPETTDSMAAIGQWELFSRRLVLTGGVRTDDISSKNFVFAQDPVTKLFLNRGEGAFSPAKESSVKNHNLGAVIKVAQWLDLYANTATNTVGAGGTDYDIFGRTLPNQEGKGYDFGLRGFFFDDRLITKVNYFNNELQNRISNPLRDGAIGIEMARQNGYVERYLEGMVLNGYGDKVAGSPRFANYTGNQLWTDVESDVTEGYELEVTFNPTKQLRMMMNVSYNDSKLNDTYAFTRPWYDQYVLPYRDDAAMKALIANPTFNATRTIGDYITGIERRLAYHEAQIGGARIRGNNWLVNVVGSYAFDQGPLKGLRVGASARWRDAPTIGYPEVAGSFDVKNAFRGAESLTTDAFVSYSWKTKLLARATNWSVSLRVRNLLNQAETFPNSAVDSGNGVPHILQRIYVQPRTYELTASMKF